MKTIWKYQLKATNTQVISMPVNAKVLHVGSQNDVMCIWVEVYDDNPLEDREFSIYGTGHPMQSRPHVHIGSCMLHGGSLVFHVYEIER